MALDQEAQGEGEPEAGPDIHYDPTQGAGTSAWQLSLRHNMEINARERRN